MAARRRALASLASGVLFGAGLALSQMINPEKILNFLDVAGNWDPSLGLVMLAGVAVTTAGFRWVLRRPGPLFASAFQLPTAREIDRKLVIGALVFGAGWGLAGYCPGPGIAALALMNWEPAVFTLAVVAGFYLQRAVSPP